MTVSEYIEIMIGDAQALIPQTNLQYATQIALHICQIYSGHLSQVSLTKEEYIKLICERR